ncbi:MAG: undecaprenyl-diphosphate phosphatase [Candidatus Heimdallarchaeaceae archaeon]|jgi:undecaprenyl-diphosphatase
MLLWIVFVLALLQGILEWLPVSSQGQTVTFLTGLIGLTPDQALDIALWLHVGTSIAVIIKYRREIYQYLNPQVREEEVIQWRWFILLSTVGTVITGVPCFLLVYYLVEDPTVGEYVMLIVGIALLITAALLFYSRKQDRIGLEIKEISKKKMTISGLLQGFSIIPGISRSGITMSGLLFMSVNKEESMKGSFIMSVPAVLGGFILDILLIAIRGGDFLPILWWQLLLAVIVTGVIGYLTMELFIFIAKRYNFAIICLVLGILTIILFALKWL